MSTRRSLLSGSAGAAVAAGTVPAPAQTDARETAPASSPKRVAVLRRAVKRLQQPGRRLELILAEHAQLYNPKGQDSGDWAELLAEVYSETVEGPPEARQPLVALWLTQPIALVAVFSAPFRCSQLDTDVRLFKDAESETGVPGLCFILRCSVADSAARFVSKVHGLATQRPTSPTACTAQPAAVPIGPRSVSPSPFGASPIGYRSRASALPANAKVTVRLVDDPEQRRWDVALLDRPTVAYVLEEVVHRRMREVPTMYSLAFSQPRHRSICTTNWLVDDKGPAALSTFSNESLYLIKKNIKFEDAFADWVSSFDTRASPLTVLRHWASFSVKRREQMLPVLEDTLALLIQEHINTLYDIAQRQSMLPSVKLNPFRLHEVGDAIDISWPDTTVRAVEIINKEQNSDVLAYIVCPHIEGFRVSCSNPLLYVPASSTGKFTLNFGAAFLPDGTAVSENPQSFTIRVQYHVLEKGDAGGSSALSTGSKRVGSLAYLERPLTPLFLRFRLRARFNARVAVPETKALRARELTPEQLRAHLNVLRVIGRGSCGTVSQVKLDDQVMAMKTFSLPRQDDEIMVSTRRALIEDFKAELAAVDDHPNIIPLLHFAVDHKRDELHILMPFLELGDLSHLCFSHSTPFPWPLRLKIALDVASALAHLHQRAICHRDLKPENVLVSSTELDPHWQRGKEARANALLSDFGCVSEIAKAEMRNAFVGTSPYKAPEAILKQGEKQLERSYATPADVYAFGILFYVISTRMTPYESAGGHIHPTKLESLVQEGLRPSLDSLPEDAPAWISDLLQNCWKQDPEKRPKMDAVVEEIHAGLCALLDMFTMGVILSPTIGCAPAPTSIPRPVPIKSTSVGTFIASSPSMAMSPSSFPVLAYKGAGHTSPTTRGASPMSPPSPMPSAVLLRVALSCHERVLQVPFGTTLASLLAAACARIFGAGDAAAMRLCNASTLAVLSTDTELDELMRAELRRHASQDTPVLLLCPKRDVAEVLLRVYRSTPPANPEDVAAKIPLCEVHRAITCSELLSLVESHEATRAALAERGVTSPFAIVQLNGALHPDEWQPLRFSTEVREIVNVTSKKDMAESDNGKSTLEVFLRRTSKERVPAPPPPPSTNITAEVILRCAGATNHVVMLPTGIAVDPKRRLRPRDGPLTLVPANSPDLVNIVVHFGDASWDAWVLADVCVGVVTQVARVLLGAGPRSVVFDKDGAVDETLTAGTVADREWWLSVPPNTVLC